MLNFDEARFLGIQSGAVALAGDINRIVGESLRDGATNIHLLGTGGVATLLQPAVQLLRRQSTFPVFSDSVSETMAAGSVNLNASSLVFLFSLSGTTKESVEFLGFAKARGAGVITLVGHADTPLGRDADHALVNYAADDTSSENFYIQSLLIALSVMGHRSELGSLGNFASLVKSLQALPQSLLAVKKAVEPKAADYARIIAGSDWHVFTGAGNVWPEAYYYGMCILEEMQWIRTRPVHASDFFHGTLELIEKGVSVILFKGEDECRPLAERVERFVPKVGGALTVLDTANYPTPDLSPALRALLAPALLATALERISAHLEVLRNHPLTTRRYYRRVEY
ncbi:MAG: SIS domain-containing protein [Mesorhizobium sp.]